MTTMNCVKYKKKILSILMLVALGVTHIAALHPTAVPVAHAQAVNVVAETSPTAIERTVSNIANTASNAISAGSLGSLVTKEFALDTIAFSIAKMMLKQITASIVQWINSGFEGSPAFVTDLEGFLVDVADQAAGQFISGTELDFLCSPFELDVRVALAQQYQADRDFTPEVQCTLSDIGNNVEGFFDSATAWDDWFELTQNTQNTPYGAYTKARAEMEARIVDAQGREITKLNWGDGTFSKELCELVEGEGTTQENCFINMPGKYISEQLTFELSTGQRTLIEADEINEIIGALFAQLAQQAITGISGILGLSQSGYSSGGSGGVGGGSGSYLDAVREEDAGDTSNSIGVFYETLADEGVYRSLFTNIEETVDDLEAENDANRDEYGSCYTLDLPSILEDFRRDAAIGTASTNANILFLTESITELEDPNTSAERQQEIYTQFQDRQSSGTFHTEVDIANVEYELRAFDDAVDEFRERMNARAAACR